MICQFILLRWQKCTYAGFSPLARQIINSKDDALLRHLYDDNQRIEPEWYCPIVPMVLLNGADGIGTGWSTRIPNYDIREVVANLKRLLDGLDPLPMVQDSSMDSSVCLPIYILFSSGILSI